MAPQLLAPAATTSLVLLLITFLPSALPQILSTAGSTIVQCSLRLLPLTSCASYVQGSTPTPADPCCDNLKQVYSQQPSCLCLLLNGTITGSFPLNKTLDMHLPLVCNLQVSSSPCSDVGFAKETMVPPSSLSSFPWLRHKLYVTASPGVALTPRPSIVEFGFPHSSSMRSKVKGNLAVAVIGAIRLLAEVLCWV